MSPKTPGTVAWGLEGGHSRAQEGRCWPFHTCHWSSGSLLPAHGGPPGSGGQEYLLSQTPTGKHLWLPAWMVYWLPCLCWLCSSPLALSGKKDGAMARAAGSCPATFSPRCLSVGNWGRSSRWHERPYIACPNECGKNHQTLDLERATEMVRKQKPQEGTVLTWGHSGGHTESDRHSLNSSWHGWNGMFPVCQIWHQVLCLYYLIWST